MSHRHRVKRKKSKYVSESCSYSTSNIGKKQKKRSLYGRISSYLLKEGTDNNSTACVTNKQVEFKKCSLCQRKTTSKTKKVRWQSFLCRQSVQYLDRYPVVILMGEQRRVQHSQSNCKYSHKVSWIFHVDDVDYPSLSAAVKYVVHDRAVPFGSLFHNLF